MGLAERKAVSAAKETEFTQFEAKVKEICGFDIKLTFDWSLIENHRECGWICDNKKASDYMFNRIVEVLTKVCSDEMGKSAVRESLKEVNMIPATGELEFKDGVLTVRNDLTGNGAYGADQIQEILEKNL